MILQSETCVKTSQQWPHDLFLQLLFQTATLAQDLKVDLMERRMKKDITNTLSQDFNTHTNIIVLLRRRWYPFNAGQPAVDMMGLASVAYLSTKM